MLTFRLANKDDISLILDFIKQLAEYEKLLDRVVTDERTLEEWIFEKQQAEVLLALDDETEVGFALFFHNFSTFFGKSGLYLEDLFVLPEKRGKGYGKAILKELARIAHERSYCRMEWCCLDDNKNSVDFYLHMGAEQMNEWTTYRLEGKTLENFANN